MNINTISALVKNERKASGLSQKAVAYAANVSRITVVNLENGNSGDIGILKLSAIANVIGLPIFREGDDKNFSKIALGNINTSYKDVMSLKSFEKLMITGEVESGFEAQVIHLLDETPVSIIAGAVKQISKRNKSNPKVIWKNLSCLAKSLKSPNEFWSQFE